VLFAGFFPAFPYGRLRPFYRCPSFPLSFLYSLGFFFPESFFSVASGVVKIPFLFKFYVSRVDSFLFVLRVFSVTPHRPPGLARSLAILLANPSIFGISLY